MPSPTTQQFGYANQTIVTPGAPNTTTVLSSVQPPMDPSLQEQKYRLRSHAFGLSVWTAILGFILFLASWGSWGMGCVTGLMAFVVGIVGAVHTSSTANLEANHCCCAPYHALGHLLRSHVALIILSLMALAGSIVSLLDLSDDVRGHEKKRKLAFRIASIVAIAASGLLVIFSAVNTAIFGKLRSVAGLDPVILSNSGLVGANTMTTHVVQPAAGTTTTMIQPLGAPPVGYVSAPAATTTTARIY